MLDKYQTRIVKSTTVLLGVYLVGCLAFTIFGWRLRLLYIPGGFPVVVPTPC